MLGRAPRRRRSTPRGIPGERVAQARDGTRGARRPQRVTCLCRNTELGADLLFTGVRLLLSGLSGLAGLVRSLSVLLAYLGAGPQGAAIGDPFGTG